MLCERPAVRPFGQPAFPRLLLRARETSRLRHGVQLSSFQKVLRKKMANTVLILCLHALLLARGDLSAVLYYSTAAFPLSSFTCLLIRDTSLSAMAPYPMTGEGIFVLLESVCIYMFSISLGSWKGLGFLTPEHNRHQFCH